MGNNSGSFDPVKYYKRNIKIIGLFYLVSFFTDDVFNNKMSEKPSKFFTRWFSMGVTAENDSVDFMGRYMSHLWVLHNEYVYGMLLLALKHFKIIKNNMYFNTLLVMSLVWRLATYRDFPSDFNLMKVYEFEDFGNRTQHHEQMKKFVYLQNHHYLSNLFPYLLGYYFRENLDIKLVENLGSTMKTWKMVSFLIHPVLIFKVIKMFDNPLYVSAAVNACTLAISFAMSGFN